MRGTDGIGDYGQDKHSLFAAQVEAAIQQPPSRCSHLWLPPNLLGIAAASGTGTWKELLLNRTTLSRNAATLEVT